MTIDQAANFLIGCILSGLGFVVIGVILILLNNLFHKFWKPIQFGVWAAPSYYPEQVDTKIENEKGANNERGTGQTKT
jgi:hypothetical protein